MHSIPKPLTAASLLLVALAHLLAPAAAPARDPLRCEIKVACERLRDYFAGRRVKEVAVVVSDGAEQVGDLLVEGDVLGSSEHHQRVGEAEECPCLVLPEDGGELGAGLGGPDEGESEGAFVGHPGAQSGKWCGGG